MIVDEALETTINLNNYNIEVVQDFVYLRVTVNPHL